MSISTHQPSVIPNCPSVQALFNVRKEVSNTNSVIASTNGVVIFQAGRTYEERKANIERFLGHPIPDPIPRCRAAAPLEIISILKMPDDSQKTKLQQAYNELQTLVDSDALQHCEQRILESLAALSDDIQERSLASLHSLAPLISSLLNTSGMQYTFTQLDLLVTKINELSQAMVLKYQMTNQEKTLQRWIDIMLTSAEKNPDNKEILIKTFKTATKALQASYAF